jgi:hypothetical protein
MNNGTGRMNVSWLTQIIKKVTRGRWRVVATCLVSDEDIDHDLLFDAFRDPLFAQRLNAFSTDLEAAAFACAYLNRALASTKEILPR